MREDKKLVWAFFLSYQKTVLFRNKGSVGKNLDSDFQSTLSEAFRVRTKLYSQTDKAGMGRWYLLMMILSSVVFWSSWAIFFKTGEKSVLFFALVAAFFGIALFFLSTAINSLRGLYFFWDPVGAILGPVFRSGLYHAEQEVLRDILRKCSYDQTDWYIERVEMIVRQRPGWVAMVSGISKTSSIPYLAIIVCKFWILSQSAAILELYQLIGLVIGLAALSALGVIVLRVVDELEYGLLILKKARAILKERETHRSSTKEDDAGLL